MILPKYRAQVDLLLQVLPYVAKENIFALKGGTAINLFVRDMPRLSVDIDLNYLPFDERKSALINIQQGLGRIKKNLEQTIRGLNINSVALNNETDVKLNCQFRNAQIKIEVNTVTRGHVFPTKLMQVTDLVQNEFGKFAAINVVSHAELFGGKICAALDRQHPRDLFDVKLLLDEEGLSDEIRQGVIVALLSHYKPIHELINPVLKNQKSAFENQFEGMASLAFSYDNYEETRHQIIELIINSITAKEKHLLYSFESGNPRWEMFPYTVIKQLPAVQWKLLNINKLKKDNPHKHHQLLSSLEKVLF